MSLKNGRRAILGVTILLCGLAFALAPNSGARGQQMSFAESVAARCKGEAAWALAPCVCTVKNRLAGGWDETHVLQAYFAQDVAPTAHEVQSAADILSGAAPCNGALWFMFSEADRRRLGLEESAALLIAAHGAWRVLFYERGAL